MKKLSNLEILALIILGLIILSSCQKEADAQPTTIPHQNVKEMPSLPVSDTTYHLYFRGVIADTLREFDLVSTDIKYLEGSFCGIQCRMGDFVTFKAPCFEYWVHWQYGVGEIQNVGWLGSHSFVVSPDHHTINICGGEQNQPVKYSLTKTY